MTKFLIVGFTPSILELVSRRLSWCRDNEKEFKYNNIKREIKTEDSFYKFVYFNEVQKLDINSKFDELIITSGCNKKTILNLLENLND